MKRMHSKSCTSALY